ncbi:MAG: hypothetical protein E8D40_11535 [Nitrospira sp.]|nr:MAG: hypothetical protein E8D40_11535 [Nitrospira sp.]
MFDSTLLNGFCRTIHSLSLICQPLVGRETRPGDPLNYPSAWQRDGAYVLVALARAGKIDLARKLAKDFAERDFFGGFGPEADAPGLGIWALMATAEQVQLTDFYNWLWPHIRRKANFIDMMLNTKSTIHQKVVGPIVPRYIKDPDLTLVAEPPRDGLILGKMHHHRPALFINAVSFQGLRDAIKLARKLGYTQDAERWEVTAKHLKMAWEKSFRPPWSDNPLTYISALWPSWIATDTREELEEHLTKRWAKKHTGHNYTTRPPWPYFEIAEAHQWLYLGKTERTWSTLQWFWDNQSSPGLYSWWGGESEENSFGSWENVRGWVSPAGVTPHHWTAAEMALLQMDMLGYIDDASHSELVIGDGVPAEWITQDMSVKGLRLNGLKVDWQWQDRIMTIHIKGTNRIDVKLGASFPESAKVKIFYLDS